MWAGGVCEWKKNWNFPASKRTEKVELQSNITWQRKSHFILNFFTPSPPLSLCSLHLHIKKSQFEKSFAPWSVIKGASSHRFREPGKGYPVRSARMAEGFWLRGNGQFITCTVESYYINGCSIYYVHLWPNFNTFMVGGVIAFVNRVFPYRFMAQAWSARATKRRGKRG